MKGDGIFSLSFFAENVESRYQNSTFTCFKEPKPPGLQLNPPISVWVVAGFIVCFATLKSNKNFIYPLLKIV